MNGKNWEKSKALTPLKKDFLKEFFLIEDRFFLTGGSALGIFYFDHLYFLNKHGFDIIAHIDAAMKKDGGLDSATLSYIISSI